MTQREVDELMKKVDEHIEYEIWENYNKFVDILTRMTKGDLGKLYRQIKKVNKLLYVRTKRYGTIPIPISFIIEIYKKRYNKDAA